MWSSYVILNQAMGLGVFSLFRGLWEVSHHALPAKLFHPPGKPGSKLCMSVQNCLMFFAHVQEQKPITTHSSPS